MFVKGTKIFLCYPFYAIARDANTCLGTTSRTQIGVKNINYVGTRDYTIHVFAILGGGRTISFFTHI